MIARLNTFIKSKSFVFLSLFVILVLAFAVRLYRVQNPIADWHSWRQADTAAVSQIYLDQGVNLLKPQYYDISTIQTGFNNPQGLRFVEFPIFNLFHIVLVKLLPQISFVILGRMVSILAALSTTFFLYKIGSRLYNKWVGLAAAFFYSALPFNIYFTRVILPDPLAVAFSVAALWLFLLYYDEEKYLYILLTGILFSLAMLTKPHAVFYGLPVVVLLAKKYSIKQLFQNVPLVVSLGIVAIPFLLWRYWITNFGNLVGVPHLSWAFNGDHIRFRPAFWRWIFGDRIGYMILGMWGLFPFTFGILSIKKKDLFLGSLLMGMFLYVSTIATANVRHDYYQTFIIPAISLTVGYGSWFVWEMKSFNKWIRRGLLLFSIGMMFLMAYDRVKEFYNINHYEIIEAGQTVDRLVPKEAKVIAPYNGDTAFLYQTKRFGWPIIATNIDDLIKLGADYYVSVNYDSDTNKYKRRFETVEQNDHYIILDLNKEL